jgi:hypothetical protein
MTWLLHVKAFASREEYFSLVVCDLSDHDSYSRCRWVVMYVFRQNYRFCGLVNRVHAYRSRGPGSIPGANRYSEKYWVWNGVHSASAVQLALT